MLDFIVMTVLPLIVLVAVLVFTVMAFVKAPSWCIGSAARGRGREALVYGVLGASALMAAIGAVTGCIGAVGYPIFSGDFDIDILQCTIVGAASYFVIELVIAIFSANGVAAAIHRQKELAPRVSAYALERFASTLANVPKLIKEQDLAAAKSDEPDELLQQLRDHMDDIGHVIDVQTTHSTTFTMVGNVMVPIATETKTNIYGISEDDLKTYPSRIAEIYSRW